VKSDMQRYFELKDYERELLPHFPGVHWKELIGAWEEFSDRSCASFLGVDASTLKEFKRWVLDS